MIADDATPAVAYLRRSTDMQERSIPDQRAYIERWAREHGYRLTGEYVDDAISGTSARGRAAFERMLADAESGPAFKAVLCYDMSRFSRGGTNETGYYLHRLSMAGVEAVFCAEGIPDGEEGELLQGVKSWQARQFSVKLSRDVIRGTISHITERRCAPGGKPPYGYDKQHRTSAGQVLRTFRWMPDGSKHELDPSGALIRTLAPGEGVRKARSDLLVYVPSAPDRVAVVRRAFEACAGGQGFHAITSRLNEEGVPAPDGGRWNSSQIKRVIENPAYRGAVAWNRRTMGKINGVGRDGRLRPKKNSGDYNNPKDDWFVVEGAHEPLVDATLFRRAHAAVAGRRDDRCSSRPEAHALLAGVIHCTHCGHRFVQKYTWGPCGDGKRRYRYYTDGGYNRGGKAVCSLSNIPADALDAWVLGRLREVLLGDEAGVKAAVDAFVAAVRSPRGAEPKRDAGREVAALDKRIKATVAMLADPAFDGLDELKATLADLKRRRDALRAEAAPETPAAVAPLDEASLRRWARERFAAIDRAVEHGPADPTGSLRRLVKAYIDRIEIDPANKSGVLYLPPDAMSCLTREAAINGAAHGDPRGGVKAKGEA